MTINPIFLRPSGNDYYKHNVVGPIVNRYGGAYWPLDDVLRSDSNVVKDFCGKYDGASGYILSAHPFQAGTPYTVISWINCLSPESSTRQNLISAAKNDSNRINLQIYKGHIYSGFYNGSTYYTRRATLSAGWKCFATSKGEGSTDRPEVYIDGVASTDSSTTSPVGSAGTDLMFIGRNAASAQYFFQGALAHAFIIPAALSAEEIRTLYLTATRGE